MPVGDEFILKPESKVLKSNGQEIRNTRRTQRNVVPVVNEEDDNGNDEDSDEETGFYPSQLEDVYPLAQTMNYNNRIDDEVRPSAPSSTDINDYVLVEPSSTINDSVLVAPEGGNEGINNDGTVDFTVQPQLERVIQQDNTNNEVAEEIIVKEEMDSQDTALLESSETAREVRCVYTATRSRVSQMEKDKDAADRIETCKSRDNEYRRKRTEFDMEYRRRKRAEITDKRRVLNEDGAERNEELRRSERKKRPPPKFEYDVIGQPQINQVLVGYPIYPEQVWAVPTNMVLLSCQADSTYPRFWYVPGSPQNREVNTLNGLTNEINCYSESNYIPSNLLNIVDEMSRMQ